MKKCLKLFDDLVENKKQHTLYKDNYSRDDHVKNKPFLLALTQYCTPFSHIAEHKAILPLNRVDPKDTI